MLKKAYLVTGGTGFIGSALVRRLVKEGHQVRVLDNNLRGVAERLKDVSGKIEVLEVDIRDAESVQKACRDMDSVCHLAFINGTEFFYTKPDLVLDVGVKGMINVIEGCLKENVKELILASSSEVYQTPLTVPTNETVSMSIPDPLNPRYSYAGGKIISELMTINYGRKFFDRAVIFRPHNVYGPDMGWEHVIPQFVLKMKKICGKTNDKKVDFSIQGTGKETRAFVFIDDFIDGLMLVLEKGKHLEIYNIGTTEEISIKDVAIEVGRYFRREIVIVPGERAKGGTLRRCPDTTKLENLDYSPKVLFRDGLKITAEWYDKNAHKKPEN
ncbi:NAD-dependent epimerase/dehydratase family protein [Chloroflexota bacterium]